MSSDIAKKIQQSVRNLPTLPTVYATLADAMANPMTTADDVAKIISNDQASAFKVLKVANSPFYGFSGRIDTITQAILHLGFNEVQNIVLALSVINLFKKKSLLDNFRIVDFWAHSIGVGVASRMIGSSIGLKNLENFFLAGILHDIGKLLFVEYGDEHYGKVLETVEENKVFIKDAERAIMGMDHAMAGRMLAEKWRLPLSIRNAIYYHHQGFVGSQPDMLVGCVHVANVFVRMLDLGYPGDDLILEPNPNVWEVLKLPEDIFTSMAQELISHFEQTINVMLIN